DDATAAYARGIAHFERFIAASPERRASADHSVALAHGGRARLAYEANDDERALAEVLASFRRRPASAATQDGLNISTVDTAKMLLTRLRAENRTEPARKLDAALQELAAFDPALLELPAYDREPPPERSGGRPGRRGRWGAGVPARQP